MILKTPNLKLVKKILKKKKVMIKIINENNIRSVCLILKKRASY